MPSSFPSLTGSNFASAFAFCCFVIVRQNLALPALTSQSTSESELFTYGAYAPFTRNQPRSAPFWEGAQSLNTSRRASMPPRSRRTI